MAANTFPARTFAHVRASEAANAYPFASHLDAVSYLSRSRRDIADRIRNFDFTVNPPDDEAIKSYDAFMSGKGFELD
ncbi:hypothetical protein [Burkholderia paludis]|uniref:hypothetical protein n=1 Tax=Burkholderia paludis TaxID=1506587 RepID=UPI00126A6B5D|nr:hypothetical protein [Burkholderia paludis]